MDEIGNIVGEILNNLPKENTEGFNKLHNVFL